MPCFGSPSSSKTAPSSRSARHQASRNLGDDVICMVFPLNTLKSLNIRTRMSKGYYSMQQRAPVHEKHMKNDPVASHLSQSTRSSHHEASLPLAPATCGPSKWPSGLVQVAHARARLSAGHRGLFRRGQCGAPVPLPRGPTEWTGRWASNRNSRASTQGTSFWVLNSFVSLTSGRLVLGRMMVW